MENPLVFRLKKWEIYPEFESLHADTSQLTATQPQFLNFITGKLELSESDHSIKLTPVGEEFGKEHSDHNGAQYLYSVLMETTKEGGGIILNNDETNRIAPESGYQRSVLFGVLKNSEKPKVRLSDHYFVRFHDETYGMFTIDMYISQILTKLRYCPTGSRNIECSD